uniref:Uncharacterized protein n=1 Tax=Setaria digitata TaxID=48799 RepID=A0A915PXX0_9BILA
MKRRPVRNSTATVDREVTRKRGGAEKDVRARNSGGSR